MRRYEDEDRQDDDFLRNDRDEEDDIEDSLYDEEHSFDGFGYMDDDGEWTDADDMDEEDEYEDNGYSIEGDDDDYLDDDEEMQYEDEDDEQMDFDF